MLALLQRLGATCTLAAPLSLAAQPSTDPDLLPRLQACERMDDATTRAACLEQVLPKAPRPESPAALAPSQSICYGKVGSGRIENAVSLPRQGANFVRMAQGPVSAGRVFVHTAVRDILLDAYADLAISRPDVRWVYGETGLPEGGPMPPHQTHQNGLSVDLFVPVLDRSGQRVQFPNRADNGYGYQVDFDAWGENATHKIDFESLAELLFSLHSAAARHGTELALVVFERQLRPALFRTPRGSWLLANIPFPSWDDRVRHDDHIHVDFKIPCR